MPGHQIPQCYLEKWVKEFTEDDTVGFLLTGSHARGDAARYSDIDLVKFVRVLPNQPAERYLVRFRDEYLVCVTVTTVPEKIDELKRPEMAIWAVPGIRQASVLADPDGELVALKRAAEDFDWQDVQRAADLYASNEVAGLSEEVHKLLNASLSDDLSGAEYAVIGLLLGLTKAAAVKLGVMIPTENSYFNVVRGSVGIDSQWSTNHLLIREGRSLKDRIRGALSLYLATADLLCDVDNGDNAAVIAATVRRINLVLTESNL